MKITIFNEEVNITIVKKRKKSISIRVNREAEIKVSAPWFVRKKTIENYILTNYEWIKEKYIEVLKNKREAEKQFISGETFLFNGKQMRLDIKGGSNKRHKVEENDEMIIIHGAPFDDDRRKESIRNILIRWYRKKALEIISDELKEISEKTIYKYESVKIKALRSTWGNCSSKGNISLNWKLIMAPEEVRRYVIIHELCHLKEMNHSPKFWQLVERECPNYKISKKWLKEKGHLLNI